jgi:uncharacterized iron-regulated protein
MKPFIKRRCQQLLTLHPTYQLILVGWSLGIFLLSTQSVNAQIANSSCRPQFVLPALSNVKPDLNKTCKDPKNLVVTPQQALSQLAQADVVYLGETHDDLQDHQTQLEIIQKLQQRNPKIAIAMEMFQRPYQSVIDDYLAGNLNEQELLEKTQYNQRWGFPWEYYAPILRFAQAKQLPVLALNTPTEVTRQVARGALESLTPKQRKFIPPFSEIRTDNDQYRQMMLNFFQRHQHGNHGSSKNFNKFFLAQVLWDETMAEKITQFIQANPDYQVVVLAGQGHIVYGHGIPSRVARRMRDKNLVQRSVLLSPSSDDLANNNQPIADFVWE